ncbi:hypothetical protein KCU71_g80, partial [Aureobasidium melanogenum]
LVNLALIRKMENNAMEDKVAMEVTKRGTRIHLSNSITGRYTSVDARLVFYLVSRALVVRLYALFVLPNGVRFSNRTTSPFFRCHSATITMQNNTTTKKEAVRDEDGNAPAASEPAGKPKSGEGLAVEELADYYANSKPPGRRYPVSMAADMLNNFIDGDAGDAPVDEKVGDAGKKSNSDKSEKKKSHLHCWPLRPITNKKWWTKQCTIVTRLKLCSFPFPLPFRLHSPFTAKHRLYLYLEQSTLLPFWPHLSSPLQRRGGRCARHGTKGKRLFQRSLCPPSSTHQLLDDAARFCALFIIRHCLMLQFFVLSPPALFFVHTLVLARSSSSILQRYIFTPSSTHLLSDNPAGFGILSITRHYLMFAFFTLSQLALFLFHTPITFCVKEFRCACLHPNLLGRLLLLLKARRLLGHSSHLPWLEVFSSTPAHYSYKSTKLTLPSGSAYIIHSYSQRLFLSCIVQISSSSVSPIKPIGSGFSPPSRQALPKDGPTFSTDTDSNISEPRFDLNASKWAMKLTAGYSPGSSGRGEFFSSSRLHCMF